MGSPMVSVFMLTYNQENYIAQAIEGVVHQKTDFKYELVIGDDASSDRTLDICREYQLKFPGMIEILENSQNMGIGFNFLRTSKELTGKYIAICDGDDYWIDKDKLQKQVNILENKPEYSIVFANYKKLSTNGGFLEPKKKFEDYQIFSAEDLIYSNFIPSVTVLFRNVLLEKSLPEWVGKLPYGDWPTYLWTLNPNSKILYRNELIAVYRSGGESTKLVKHLSKSLKTKIFILRQFLSLSNYRYIRKQIIHSLILKKKSLMLAYNREGKFLLAFFHFLLLNLKFQRGITRIYLFSLKKKFCV